MPDVKEKLAAHIAKNNSVPIVTGFLGKAVESGMFAHASISAAVYIRAKLRMPFVSTAATWR